MTKREQTLFHILIITFIGCGAVLILLRVIGNYYREQLWLATENSLPIHKAKTRLAAPISLSDGRLRVDQPRDGATVPETFTVSGYAQNWFEGTINIQVLDANKKILYKGNTLAADSYQHPALFQSQIVIPTKPTTADGVIEFNDHSAKDGSLAYQKIVSVKFKDYSP